MKESILMELLKPTLTQSSERFEKVLGSELKRLDTIKVWWSGGGVIDGSNVDTIVEIKEYTGPLKYLFPEHGAQVAVFIVTRMTIDNSQYYYRLIKE